jgi:DNA-binding NarL/FixJ family response regulator
VTPPRPRLLLIDPRRVLREAMSEALEVDHHMDLVAMADDVSSAVLQAQRVAPDVVIVASVLLGPLPQICAALRDLNPRPRVLVIDADPSPADLLHAIEAGVDGYLTGENGLEDLAAAVAALDRGESVVPPFMLGPLLRSLIQRQRAASRASEKLGRLTPREREVLSVLTEGLGDTGIAERLVISPETARTHVQRILRKLEVRSRLDAISLLAQTGLTAQLERMIEGSTS